MKPEEKRLKKAFEEDNEQFQERAKKLEASTPDETKHGSDFQLPVYHRQQEVGRQEHVTKKVYLFPPSYNALREELENNWQEFFVTINPLTKTSPAWCMVYDAPQFVGYLNGFTGLAVQFDSESVDSICSTFLNALRKMRGVKEIH